MKTSEIIKILQENIDKYGDLHCLSDNEGGPYKVGKVRVLHMPSSELIYPDGEFILDKEEMKEIGDSAFFLEL